MRVLLTTDTVGGVWTYSLELARGLGARDNDVVLATLGSPPSPEQLREAQPIRGLTLHALECRLPWMEDPWEDVATAGRWLTSLANDVGPDIVHLSEPVLAAARGWEAPTLVVGHSCVLSWWEAVLGEPAPDSWQRYREGMRAGLGAATVVAAPSRWMLNALRRHYGVRNGRVVPNGRTATLFPAGPKEDFVFTATRVWDPAKNVLALDRAAEGLPWPVYAAGDDSPPGQTGPLVPAHIQLLGRLAESELAGWLARASVFALPARYEPFGLSVLEAALAGCALVLGDIPSLRETWDGVAVFVPPDDERILREALTTVIEDPALRQTLAMRARRRALGLTGERMTSHYLELYRTALSRPSTARRGEVPACAS